MAEADDEKVTEPEDEEDDENEVGGVNIKLLPKSRSSSESSRSSRKVDRQSMMSPTNLYPALKNSTVVSGGEPFVGGPLGMSPIRLSDAETPTTVQSTPPTLSAIGSQKHKRSVPQSPMFMNVMQKAIDKSSREHNEQVTDRTSRGQTSPAAKRLSAPKGNSVSNPAKGKSLVMPSLDEKSESSDNDWEYVEEDAVKRNPLVDIIMEAAHDVRWNLAMFYEGIYGCNCHLPF